MGNKISFDIQSSNNENIKNNDIYEKQLYDSLKENLSLDDLVKKYGNIITMKTNNEMLYFESGEEGRFIEKNIKKFKHQFVLKRANIYTYEFSNGKELIWKIFPTL